MADIKRHEPSGKALASSREQTPGRGSEDDHHERAPRLPIPVPQALHRARPAFHILNFVERQDKPAFVSPCPVPGLFPDADEPLDVTQPGIDGNGRLCSRKGRTECRARVIHPDEPARVSGRAHAPQRLPHEGRLAGLARTGDGHDSRRQVAGEELDEVVDEGAFEGIHGNDDNSQA